MIKGRERPALAILLSAWLASAALSADASDTDAPVSDIAERIDQCFVLRDRSPADAVELARSVLETPELASDDAIKLLSCLARAEALVGRSDDVVATVDRIEALLREAPRPPDFELRALSNAGAALHASGHVPRALDLYRRAFEAAKAGDADLAQVKMLTNVGSIHSEQMDAYALAERTYAQAQGIADRHGLADPLLHYNRGLNALRQGEPDRARAQFRAAAALEPQAESLLGRRIAAEFAALDGGPDAMPRLAALAEAQRIDDPSGAAITRLRLSSLALAAGRTQDALTHADAAIALVGGSGFQRERRDGLRARVEALRAGGRLDAALAALEQLHREEREAVRMQNLDALAGLQARLEDGRSAEELQRLRETQRIDALQARHAQTLRTAGAIGLLLLVALASAFALYQRRISRRLRRLSTIDSLTGLLNRRAATAAMETFPPPAAIARRHVAFLVDVDHFKRSNDRHGHGVGDAILVEIARRFQQVCRPGDLVARWGGEEFLIVARALDAESAAAIAERLRREIAGRPVAVGETTVALTISIGFACRPDGRGRDGWRAAIDLADRALYASKRGGRDAWTGLWFDATPSADVIRDLLQEPATTIATGAARVMASRTPVEWQRRERREATTASPPAAATGVDVVRPG